MGASIPDTGLEGRYGGHRGEGRGINVEIPGSCDVSNVDPLREQGIADILRELGIDDILLAGNLSAIGLRSLSGTFFTCIRVSIGIARISSMIISSCDLSRVREPSCASDYRS